MHRTRWLAPLGLCLAVALLARAENPKLENYFPPPESRGGWRTAVPINGEPSAEQKARLKALGIDWTKLKEAWDHNAAANDGKTGLLVIYKGHVVGEWYKDCTKDTAFNIYSSSKAYTSVAFGLLLADSDAGKLTGGKKLTLDTKVVNQTWLPEALPLPDPRKADITLRHLLNMASGLGTEPVPTGPGTAPFETALGKTEGSPFAKLKDDPGTKFYYSNAGVAHLVLVFQHAAGKDLFPFMKERVLDPIGMENVKWQQIGGDGKIGPYSQGYSGVTTSAREHARFCQLALHKGKWGDKQVVPASYYDFAWAGTKVNETYGAQWWVYPKHKDAPKDLVQTAGARNNHGYAVPSRDLVFVRVGDGEKFPKDFEKDLVTKVLAAIVK